MEEIRLAIKLKFEVRVKSSFIFSRGKCNVKKFSTILTIFIAPLRKVGEWETVRGYKDENERVSVCVCE